ncbi:hypothetical protein [Anaerophilus nitritogenes]|uniref:hypothetical protein n=1 Tax=Anaerophilus nitritogenes TaxID=2498136 RepID=UPI0013EDD08E|nr:hypothetical protein [Anaerophilus nitritogenes]
MENLEIKQNENVEVEETKEETKKEEVKTFKEEDVQKIIQSETDKVRTEYSKKVKVLEEELIKLKPAEKSETELKLEQKLKELDEKEKQIQAKERQFKVQDTLTANNLPKELSKFINAGDDDLDNLGKEIADILNKHLLNSSYKPKTHKPNDGITKDQFKQMNYMERLKLQQSNPTLYSKLSE